MLAKLLGILDLLCLVIILTSKFMPHRIIMTFGMLLCIKGFIFASMGDKASILDCLGGIYMGLLVYGFSNGVINLFFTLFLGQKGLLSLFAR